MFFRFTVCLLCLFGPKSGKCHPGRRLDPCFDLYSALCRPHLCSSCPERRDNSLSDFDRSRIILMTDSFLPVSARSEYNIHHSRAISKRVASPLPVRQPLYETKQRSAGIADGSLPCVLFTCYPVRLTSHAVSCGRIPLR